MPKEATFSRKEVLQKASAVFHQKGYNGTSMQDLVDSTGLNRSSIYNSFGSKLQLFLEALAFYQSSNNARMNKSLLGHHNASDTIKAVFELYLQDILADKDKKGCLLVNCKSEMANQEANVQSFLENNQERTLAMLEDIVYNGQMERVFNETQSASDYALYLYASLQGLRMTGILHQNEQQLRTLINTILKVIH
ncbi:TetR/AcrR family transcriptional regulator [Aquimarina brevivitae]|uniref:TetR family transcriptional regulator n=1 Tax=Aquimarina brevivitae TaxID=323412 RepID=A0A4V2F5T3_9FLAO|nr:TetR/AcrR family transcriptional regulator [Aquimarina brevivitae]RZS93919.1 TetR family transcriptional regulator [Aquimarina brevivitae]